ncbi:MAG: 1-deoxy-D-xylulose-5-phosphate synthase [Candidatus Aphodosoma sp.]
MEYKLLENIDFPSDLKQHTTAELPEICDELRNFIIEQLADTPGHLGANLGVIELTVALHYVFNAPYDKMIWDVGHQAYAHKILTGRRKQFNTNRKFKGLCGFPTPKESEYDAFGTGHSSTSISAALGMSIAAKLKGEENRHIIAVIGDGALTGGLAFEGLNNASTNDNNLLIILNDNNMAIDPIRGGFNQYLTNLHFNPTYNKLRFKAYHMLRKMGIMDDNKHKSTIRLGNTLKGLRSGSNSNNIFEGLNIRYFGPIDGHDVQWMVQVLNEIKDYKGPKVLHIITKKGKGYKPAEEEVTTWHAPGKYNATTGERIKASTEGEPPLFQTVFGNTLLELAKTNDKIVGITPAMPSGCSMNIMMQEMPERTFDVGIAEGHAVTFSAGLAKEGMIPFCNIYSSFMQRAYDNVIHDVALQNLHVIMCLDRAGLVGSDGATHQGQFDIAMFRCIPNLTIAVPRNEHILRNMMYTAVNETGPYIIRYPRGKGILVDWHNEMQHIETGKGEMLIEGKDIAIVGVGPLLYQAQKAIERADKELGINAGLYDLRFAKPIDEELLKAIAEKYDNIITIEDGTMIGGIGSAIEDWLLDKGYKGKKVDKMGLPDAFIEHGTQPELYRMLEIDSEGIFQKIKNINKQ